MPKRILIFSLVYFPKFVGGAEIALKEITDRINPEVLDFDMLTIKADKETSSFERLGNINIYRIGFGFKKGSLPYGLNLSLMKYLFPFLSSYKAQKLNQKQKYDGLWALMANYAGFGASFFKKKYPEIPFLLTLQEGDPLEYIKKRVGLLSPVFRRIFRRADIIQAISTYLGNWGTEMGFKGIPEIIPNAVDIENFTKAYSGDELAGLEEKLEKEPGDVFLVSASRLVKKNAVDVVIQSLKYLPKNVKFLVIGSGELEKKLKKQTLRLGLSERVKFIGHISHDDLPKYLRISDIFVRPSRSEGLGNSFLEAMAVGLPVIATKVGGIPDFLKNGVNGFYVKVDDPKDLSLKIKMLSANQKLCEEMGKCGREMVIKKYNWDKITNDMIEKVFKRLIYPVK